MEEELIELNCEVCGVKYTKPANYLPYLDETNSVFYKWSLRYCDKHRREKELESFKRLPKVLKALSENL